MKDFPASSVVKNLTSNAGDAGCSLVGELKRLHTCALQLREAQTLQWGPSAMKNQTSQKHLNE